MAESYIYDDWHEETQARLAKSFIYQVLQAKSLTTPSGSHVLSLVDTATTYAYQKTKTILRHMGEFTLHDGEHLFRVLHLMERLLPKKTVEELSIPELMLLILTAFFHDIGMAPEESCVISWKKVWDFAPEFENIDDETEYNKFNRFVSARPDQLAQINQHITIGNATLAETLKGYLIAEYIRHTHSERAKEIINKDWNEKIIYRDSDLTEEFAQLCFSHNQDALVLLDMDKKRLCGPDTYLCLPLIGAILRIADILDFDAKRTPKILFSHLAVKHPVSVIEWNKHTSIDGWEINQDEIKFQTKCRHPAIEAAIHEFCDLIDRELSACNNVITAINEFYKISNKETFLKIPFKVDRTKIETKKDVFGNPLYLFRETKFKLSKKQVIDLLMGTQLYSDPEVALRELLQNSIDACLLREALEKKWGNSYSPNIVLKYFKENDEDILQIEDNGTGMDQDIIDNYYSQVGSSFYKSSEFYELQSKTNTKLPVISRFGIGILSCFMVADTLIVDTRRIHGPHKSSDAINLIVEGQESIFWIKPGTREVPGTTTKLILRKKTNPWEKYTENEFLKSVENVIPNPPFKINIETESYKENFRDQSSFKEIRADSLKEYSWAEHENIKQIEIVLNELSSGIVGSAIVGILQTHALPTEKVEITSKDIEIEGEQFSLKKVIKMNTNEIESDSTSITVNDERQVKVDSRWNTLAKSKSKISLHGIHVATTLFPQSYEIQPNQVRLAWPFPILLVIDICGNRDLDLNSARTQIIMGDKWEKFEEELSYLVCSSVKESVPKDYWNGLVKIWKEKGKNKNSFLAGLMKTT